MTVENQTQLAHRGAIRLDKSFVFFVRHTSLLFHTFLRSTHTLVSFLPLLSFLPFLSPSPNLSFLPALASNRTSSILPVAVGSDSSNAYQIYPYLIRSLVHIPTSLPFLHVSSSINKQTTKQFAQRPTKSSLAPLSFSQRKRPPADKHQPRKKAYHDGISSLNPRKRIRDARRHLLVLPTSPPSHRQLPCKIHSRPLILHVLHLDPLCPWLRILWSC